MSAIGLEAVAVTEANGMPFFYWYNKQTKKGMRTT